MLVFSVLMSGQLPVRRADTIDEHAVQGFAAEQGR